MMEELIILNADDREKLKGLFVSLITESDPKKEFEFVWQMEKMLLTNEDIYEVTESVRNINRKKILDGER